MEKEIRTLQGIHFSAQSHQTCSGCKLSSHLFPESLKVLNFQQFQRLQLMQKKSHISPKTFNVLNFKQSFKTLKKN